MERDYFYILISTCGVERGNFCILIHVLLYGVGRGISILQHACLHMLCTPIFCMQQQTKLSTNEVRMLWNQNYWCTQCIVLDTMIVQWSKYRKWEIREEITAEFCNTLKKIQAQGLGIKLKTRLKSKQDTREYFNLHLTFQETIGLLFFENPITYKYLKKTASLAGYYVHEDKVQTQVEYCQLKFQKVRTFSMPHSPRIWCQCIAKEG